MKGQGGGTTDFFQVFFLSPCKIEHLVGVFDEDCALGFGLGDVERGSEDGDLRSGDLFDDALWLTTKDHALYYAASGEVTSHDLDDAYVVHVEVFWVGGHDCQCGLCDEGR